ncbi:hypothetical protein BC826DRAFT_974698 [Russula brevipes]|nr:hypothetical protein BC826DRAFT_974698 [Russula brevipes]
MSRWSTLSLTPLLDLLSGWLIGPGFMASRRCDGKISNQFLKETARMSVAVRQSEKRSGRGRRLTTYIRWICPFHPPIWQMMNTLGELVGTPIPSERQYPDAIEPRGVLRSAYRCPRKRSRTGFPHIHRHALINVIRAKSFVHTHERDMGIGNLLVPQYSSSSYALWKLLITHRIISKYQEHLVVCRLGLPRGGSLSSLPLLPLFLLVRHTKLFHLILRLTPLYVRQGRDLLHQNLLARARLTRPSDHSRPDYRAARILRYLHDGHGVGGLVAWNRVKGGTAVVVVVVCRNGIGNGVGKWWLPIAYEHGSERKHSSSGETMITGFNQCPWKGRGDVRWL